MTYHSRDPEAVMLSVASDQAPFTSTAAVVVPRSWSSWSNVEGCGSAHRALEGAPRLVQNALPAGCMYRDDYGFLWTVLELRTWSLSTLGDRVRYWFLIYIHELVLLVVIILSGTHPTPPHPTNERTRTPRKRTRTHEPNHTTTVTFTSTFTFTSISMSTSTP